MRRRSSCSQKTYSRTNSDRTDDTLTQDTEDSLTITITESGDEDTDCSEMEEPTSVDNTRRNASAASPQSGAFFSLLNAATSSQRRSADNQSTRGRTDSLLVLNRTLRSDLELTERNIADVSARLLASQNQLCAKLERLELLESVSTYPASGESPALAAFCAAADVAASLTPPSPELKAKVKITLRGLQKVFPLCCDYTAQTNHCCLLCLSARCRCCVCRCRFD